MMRPVAPIIGGWVHVAFGWRAVFAVMVVCGVVFATDTTPVSVGSRSIGTAAPPVAEAPTASARVSSFVIGWPVMFFPVHIVFLEFVIDPACSVVFEAEQSEETNECPTNRH